MNEAREVLVDAGITIELFVIVAFLLSSMLAGALLGWIVRRWNLDGEDDRNN